MATLLAVDKLVRHISMHVVELAERGAHVTPGRLLPGRPAEENEVRPLQGLRDPGRVDDAVKRCAQSTTATSEVSCSGSGAFCFCG
jgi:hypothetical protein